MKKTIIALAAVGLLAVGAATAGYLGAGALYHDAKADGAAEARAELDAGVAAAASPDPAPADPVAAPLAPAAPAGDAATTAPTAKPSDTVDDPAKAPVAYFDDVKAAKKIGWPALVAVVLRGLFFLVSFLGGFLAPLRKGWVPDVLAIAGAGTAAMVDSALLGGTWLAVGFAALMAILYFKKPPERAPAGGA